MNDIISFFIRIDDDTDVLEEGLMTTTREIRDAALARQLQYEELHPHPQHTQDLDTIKQTMCDSIYARKLDRCQQLGLYEI